MRKLENMCRQITLKYWRNNKKLQICFEAYTIFSKQLIQFVKLNEDWASTAYFRIQGEQQIS